MAADRERAVFDAAVIGAGPAGSASARWLALQGWRVGLLERTRFEAPRVGESLPPNIQKPLRELGLWSEFLALSPLPSWGTDSVWGDATQQSRSHLFTPYGCGWHVDRQAFDQMLAHAAAAAGASLFQGVTLRGSEHRTGWWWLHTTGDAHRAEGSGQTLRARVLIDATGRRAQVARSLGAKCILFDRLVGVATHWAGVDVAEQRHLLVEAAREGWWYSAPLPARKHHEVDAMIAMLMTDADLCARLRLTTTERWQAVLQSTQVTRRRLDLARCVSTPQVHCAYSQRLSRDGASDAGPWLAVGDATLAVDPISGSGVMRALGTARAAADTVNELLGRPHARESTLNAYEAARDKECTSYLLERAQYYEAAHGLDAPFWQRRQVMRPHTADAADRIAAAA